MPVPVPVPAPAQGRTADRPDPRQTMTIGGSVHGCCRRDADGGGLTATRQKAQWSRRQGGLSTPTVELVTGQSIRQSPVS